MPHRCIIFTPKVARKRGRSEPRSFGAKVARSQGRSEPRLLGAKVAESCGLVCYNVHSVDQSLTWLSSGHWMQSVLRGLTISLPAQFCGGLQAVPPTPHHQRGRQAEGKSERVGVGPGEAATVAGAADFSRTCSFSITRVPSTVVTPHLHSQQKGAPLRQNLKMLHLGRSMQFWVGYFLCKKGIKRTKEIKPVESR